MQSFTFIIVFSAKYWTVHQYFIHKMSYIERSLVKKINTRLALFITQMETKWTKWHSVTSHVIGYRSLELIFSMHTFHFNCFFEDFNCVFTQIRCLSRVLGCKYVCLLLSFMNVPFLHRELNSIHVYFVTLWCEHSRIVWSGLILQLQLTAVSDQQEQIQFINRNSKECKCMPIA